MIYVLLSLYHLQLFPLQLLFLFWDNFENQSLNSVYVLEKYWISLLGLKKSLKFTTLSTLDTFFRTIRLFFRGKFGSSSV